MKKSVTLILMAVIALSVVALFVEHQISELQNQIDVLQTQNNELQNQNTRLLDNNRSLQSQISYLQNQLNNSEVRGVGHSPVRITESKFIDGKYAIVGVTVQSKVNVIVQNEGNSTISGLTLTIRLLDKSTYSDLGSGYSTQVNDLKGGESKEFSGNVYHSFGSYNFIVECTLKFGDIVLDESTHILG